MWPLQDPARPAPSINGAKWLREPARSIIPANIEFQNLLDVQQPYKSSCYQPEATDGTEKKNPEHNVAFTCGLP